jgi:hypothetical protein
LEILALLLLGFIAMLAIVPPIIRGKLEESPLVTSQNFQRSMQEMANSLEPYGRQGDSTGQDSAGNTDAARPVRQSLGPVRPSPRSQAAMRRNRVITILAVFASVWGVATLISGMTWCLVIFLIASCFLVVYYALSLLVPHFSSPVHATSRMEETSRPPERQAI